VRRGESVPHGTPAVLILCNSTRYAWVGRNRTLGHRPYRSGRGSLPFAAMESGRIVPDDTHLHFFHRYPLIFNGSRRMRA